MFLIIKRLSFTLVLTMFITISLKAQSITPVKKEVVYQELNSPLPGAKVVVIESDPILALTVAEAFNEQETKLYDGLFSDPTPKDAGYVLHEMTRDSNMNLNKNRLKIAGTLNHTFNTKHNLETSTIKNDPPAFQKNLFNQNLSLRSNTFRRAFAAPILLTAAGLSTLDDYKYQVQEERNRGIPNFRNNADDYLQYSPIFIVYGLNGLGVKGKNDFANRTAILIKSELMLGVLTFSLKRITAIPRPDTKALTSFPSGHTAQAFAAATFMAREYGYKSIWYSIGAYTVATGVGAMRVMNNRHWIPDVLVGASIGILSTNLAYLTHQYRWGKTNKRSQTSVIPSYNGQAGMVNIIHRFN